MDDELLGLSAHFDYQELIDGFAAIIDKLDELGVMSSDASSKMQAAFSNVSDAISNGDTVTAVKFLGDAFDEVKNKVVETLQAVSDGKSDLGFEQVAGLVTNYRDLTIEAVNATQQAYTAELENVNRLESELSALLDVTHQMAEAGDTRGLESMGKRVDEAAIQLEQAKERTQELKEKLSEATSEAQNAQTAFDNLGEAAQKVAKAEAADALDEVNEYLSDFAERAGSAIDGMFGIGKNLDGLRAGFELLPPGIQSTIKGISKMTVAGLKFIATPLGAALAAIALALNAVYTWFNKSASGQLAFAKVSAYVGSLLDSLTDVIVKVGEYIFKAFTEGNGALNAFAKSLVNTLSSAASSAYHTINGLVGAVKALKNYLTDLNYSTQQAEDDLSAAWNELKKGGNAFVETWSNTIETIQNGWSGIGKIGSDVWQNSSLEGMKEWFKTAADNAAASANYAGQQFEIEKQIGDIKEQQADLMGDIEAKQEEINKLSGAAKKEEIAKLRTMQTEYYDKEIAARRKALELSHAQNSLHSITIEELDKEQTQRTAILRLEQQKAAAMRRNTQMSEQAEKQINTQASRSAKAAEAQAKRDKTMANAINKAEEKYYKTVYDNTNKRTESVLELEAKLAEARIGAMKDGAAKILAEREFEHKKEMQQIAKEMREAVQAERNRQIAEFEAQQAIIKAGGGVTRKWDEEKDLDQNAINTIKAQYEELGRLSNRLFISDQQQIAVDSMDEYIRKYGDFASKQALILQEYERKVTEAGDDSWAALLASKERDEALNKLKADYGLVAQEMADLFADSANKSVSEIDKIIKKYEALISFMQGSNGKMFDKDGNPIDADGGDVTRDDLLNLGFSNEDIEKIQNGEIKITEVAAAIKKLKSELSGRSPFKSLSNDISEAIEKLKKGDIGGGVSEIGNAVKSFTPAVKQFGSAIADIFGFDDAKLQSAIDGISGLGDAAAGVGQALSGDIVGGAMSAVGGISKLVGAFEGIFGADYSQYNRLVEEYEKLESVWDSLIDKKTEYISISYGKEILQATDEAAALLNKEAEAWRKLGVERLNSGASIGSHSIGQRMVRAMDNGDWADLSSVLGGDARSILGNRLSGLFSLSASQLQRLKEGAPSFWAKMDADVQKYLEKIIDGAERLDDIEQRSKERLTQISFDGMVDNFTEKLLLMDSRASDFANDVSQYFAKAMLNNKIGELFGERLEKWYDQFAEGLSDGDLDDNERRKLMDDYNGIVDDAIKVRDEIFKATGYSENSSGQRSGSFRAEKGFTYEQANEISGRAASIQIGQLTANTQREGIINTLQPMFVNLGSLLETSRLATGNISEIRAIQETSLRRLTEISDNTNFLRTISSDLQRVRAKVDNL